MYTILQLFHIMCSQHMVKFIYFTISILIVIIGVLHASVSLSILILLMIINDSISFIHIAIIFEITVVITVSALVLYSLIHKQWYKRDGTKSI